MANCLHTKYIERGTNYCGRCGFNLNNSEKPRVSIRNDWPYLAMFIGGFMVLSGTARLLTLPPIGSTFNKHEQEIRAAFRECREGLRDDKEAIRTIVEEYQEGE